MQETSNLILTNFQNSFHPFPFWHSMSFPVSAMYEPRYWRSSVFSISSPLSWRLVLGILQVIRLVFVVFMCRPTSLAVRPSKSNWLWASSKDSSSSIMSSAKSRLLTFSAGYRCDRRDHSEAWFFIVPPQSTQSSTVMKEKEPRCLVIGHLFWLSPDFHLTFSCLWTRTDDLVPQYRTEISWQILCGTS